MFTETILALRNPHKLAGWFILKEIKFSDIILVDSCCTGASITVWGFDVLHAAYMEDDMGNPNPEDNLKMQLKQKGIKFEDHNIIM